MRERFFITFFVTLVFIFNQSVLASGSVKKLSLENINRTEINNENDRERIQNAAVLLANYEIEAKKLISDMDESVNDNNNISQHAEKLISISESFIESAQFRLPQCDEYLAKTIALKNNLQEISHETLEKDYHMDGALPKAPGECYHTKDLFVHPATVIVLTRDDPELGIETKEAIKAEITEVLAHTEVVRQLVIY